MKNLFALTLAMTLAIGNAWADVVQKQSGGYASFVVTFPDVHADARIGISLERTVRVPDDGKSYPLPPSLGSFPAEQLHGQMRCAAGNRCPGGRTTPTWLVPMLQSEAMWINFWSDEMRNMGGGYPARVRILAGQIDAVSGMTVPLKAEEVPPEAFPKEPQGYVELPTQLWLDGFRTKDGIVRQLVAEQIGKGRTAEEQLVDGEAIGGLWIGVKPYRAEAWEKILEERKKEESWIRMLSRSGSQVESMGSSSGGNMGLAPGGEIVQQILEPRLKAEDFEETTTWFRIEMVTSLQWLERTGRIPPQAPPDARTYTKLGYPWFTYWDQENEALAGETPLTALKSLGSWNKEDETVTIPQDQVRDLNKPLKPSAIGN